MGRTRRTHCQSFVADSFDAGFICSTGYLPRGSGRGGGESAGDKIWQEMFGGGGGGETAKKLKACKTETSERFTAHQAETALLLDITSAS